MAVQISRADCQETNYDSREQIIDSMEHALSLQVDQIVDSLVREYKKKIEEQDAEINSLKVWINKDQEEQNVIIDSLLEKYKIQSESLHLLAEEKDELENRLNNVKILLELSSKNNELEQGRLRRTLYFISSVLFIMLLLISTLVFYILTKRLDRVKDFVASESRNYRSELKRSLKKFKKGYRQDIRKLRKRKKK